MATDYFNKDENSMCFVLQAHNKTVLEWYYSLNGKFKRSPVEKIKKKMEAGIDDDEVIGFRNNISELTHDKLYRPVIYRQIVYAADYSRYH
jgi:hypothetical protein